MKRKVQEVWILSSLSKLAIAVLTRWFLYKGFQKIDLGKSAQVWIRVASYNQWLVLADVHFGLHLSKNIYLILVFFLYLGVYDSIFSEGNMAHGWVLWFDKRAPSSHPPVKLNGSISFLEKKSSPMYYWSRSVIGLSGLQLNCSKWIGPPAKYKEGGREGDRERRKRQIRCETMGGAKIMSGIWAYGATTRERYISNII